MKAYVKNTLILSTCMLLSKMLGALYRIPLSNILGTEGIGLYQMVFPVYSLFLVAITGGMPVYVAQKVSKFRANNDNESINKVIKNSVVLSMIIAIIFCFVLIVFSMPLAYLQGNKNAYLGYITVAISIIFSAITSVYKGYFQGMEVMSYNAGATIIEQIIKLCVGLLGAIFLSRFGIIYAVCGAFAGVLASEIITFIFMFFMIKKFNTSNTKGYVNAVYVKKIFKQFLPISLASIILPLSSCVDSFLVVNLLLYTKVDVSTATSLFGIATGMVAPMINFPILLCGTISTAFLPTLVYMVEKKQPTKDIVSGTYFFVWLFSLPCVFGFIAIAPYIINLFFPSIESQFVQTAIIYLCISSFNIIYLSITQISTSILNGFGKFKLPFVIQTFAFILKNVIFIPLVLTTKLGIISLCVATTISEGLTCILELYLTRKNTLINLKLKKILVPLFSAIIMFIFAIVLNRYLHLNQYLNLCIIVFISVITYFGICFAFGVIKIKEIKNMFNKNKSVNKIKYE